MVTVLERPSVEKDTIELKVPTTYDEQISILKDRGCDIKDDEEDLCKAVLERINYYRFSAYFLPYKNADGTYVDGTNFHDVYQTYEFDRKLRHILYSALEEVEIFWRSQLSYFHAHKYGALGYMDSANFNARHNHEKYLEIFEKEVSNNENIPFVKHHLTHYKGQFPVWVAVELFTFGSLSFFYNDLQTTDQKALAKIMYGENYKNVSSWLRCCTDLRNICAHYGRLYYRTFTAVPKNLDLSENEERKLWASVLALRKLYPNAGKWNSEIVRSLEELIAEYTPSIKLEHIGFPKDWNERLEK